MPNSHRRNPSMADGLDALAPRAADATTWIQGPEPTQRSSVRQTRLRGWLHDAFLSCPTSRRCQRWDVLRALRRELDE
ncbi:hypothetical protein [Lamprobacter modestohalophilus]|uniref:hypothetical protein n=1 Tax=Lamprobacter modestohalophilus TaxID=1064514 RepID=UPI001904955D|nr:hypothetical protein [Lamprobacter modestohalophilus]